MMDSQMQDPLRDDEDDELREIQVIAQRKYPGRGWDELNPSEQKAVYRSYDSERSVAQGYLDAPAPQGHTGGPLNVYYAPNWADSLSSAVSKGVGAYQMGKSHRAEAKGRKALADMVTRRDARDQASEERQARLEREREDRWMSAIFGSR